MRERGAGGKGGEMTQKLYAHMNKRNNKKKKMLPKYKVKKKKKNSGLL
jgi:hypothetical protein